MKSPITTHVLDTTEGIAATGVKVTLSFLTGNEFQTLNTEFTNEDGRCLSLLSRDLKPGIFKLRFEISEYFNRKGVKSFFPFAEIVFEVEAGRDHYHVPLVITPFAYNTYRGT